MFISCFVFFVFIYPRIVLRLVNSKPLLTVSREERDSTRSGVFSYSFGTRRSRESATRSCCLFLLETLRRQLRSIRTRTALTKTTLEQKCRRKRMERSRWRTDYDSLKYDELCRVRSNYNFHVDKENKT